MPGYLPGSYPPGSLCENWHRKKVGSSRPDRQKLSPLEVGGSGERKKRRKGERKKERRKEGRKVGRKAGRFYTLVPVGRRIRHSKQSAFYADFYNTINFVEGLTA